MTVVADKAVTAVVLLGALRCLRTDGEISGEETSLKVLDFEDIGLSQQDSQLGQLSLCQRQALASGRVGNMLLRHGVDRVFRGSETEISRKENTKNVQLLSSYQRVG